jgi:antitoxin (DNA-binding transcriptional repressor) of toxin-antitoxin stability system
MRAITKERIIGVKELRENLEKFIARINKGKTFLVVRRSKPVFTLSPPGDDGGIWESVIDFTKIKRGGIAMRELLSRL